MLEGLTGLAGAIVAGNKIAGATKNVVNKAKSISSGFKKYYGPAKSKKANFKKKATPVAKTPR